MTLVSMFTSGGYIHRPLGQAHVGRNYIYANRISINSISEHGLTNPRNMDSMSISPVHGFPIPAKHTLLAQLLKSGTAFPDSLSNYPIMDYIRGVRDSKKKKKEKVHIIQKVKQMMPLGTLLGVEIEHYPVTRTTLNSDSLGSYCHDASLDQGGIELRKLTWVGRNGRLNGVLSLKPLLENATVNARCGLHVHVDIRHLPVFSNETQFSVGETYDRLCSIYPILKKLVPPSRLKSRYCKWYNNRYGSDSYHCNSYGSRYCALNYDSVSEHGTIEWRMGSGSTNVLKIESWALLCQFLTRWASIQGNTMPRNWDQFIAILPQWLASWCVLRRERLYGDLGPVDERVGSAVSQNE